MDEYVHLVYRLTKKFPKEELFGVVSQLRRSALSVILNYIEGYRAKKIRRLQSLYKFFGNLICIPEGIKIFLAFFVS